MAYSTEQTVSASLFNRTMHSLEKRFARVKEQVISLPLVKFRRGGDNYEDLDGQSRDKSVSQVEISPSPTDGNNGAEGQFTVEQCVDQLGFGMFQVKLSFLTGLAWMADAMEMMILSILSPALHCDWGIPSWQQAFTTTIVFCGMMLSSSIWGSICDKYGRRAALLLSSLFTFYFGILSAVSPTFVWLLVLRGLVGFGVGGAPQAVTLYAEFLPTAIRAKAVVMIEIFWALGAVFETLLALLVMPHLGWRYLLGLSAIPLLIFAAFCVWLPESARFDIARGHPEKALATLERIAKENGKPMPQGRLIYNIPKVTEENVKRGQLKDLFSIDLRKTTIILWVIWLACAFSYYGIVLMTTELFETGDKCHGGTGDSGKVELACLLDCKMLSTKDYTDLLWTSVAEFPGLFITAAVIEKLGRKKTMAGEFVVFSFFVFLLNLCTNRPLLTFFIFVARAFISGAFQAAYVYTPEVYPTTMRALGLGTCSGMARIGAIVTPFVAQVMLTSSPSLAVSTYGAIALIAAIAAMLLPIETQGKEMKEKNASETSKLLGSGCATSA
ncbi:synaptic vesicle 2-related protein-like isoform X2 [Tubulanus polymorphus]|uniref:synaptic vesicle 2-related protein-like isoform X2 n=1 Tax=Tubulanus polymorphus TaxID=672921 RepID=UPI003DA2351D